MSDESEPRRRETIDLSDKIGGVDGGFDRSTLRMLMWPLIIGFAISGLFWSSILIAVDEGIKFDEWRDTATCDELRAYAIENIDDKGTNSGIEFMGSDIPGDQYDQVMTLIELKCKQVNLNE